MHAPGWVLVAALAAASCGGAGDAVDAPVTGTYCISGSYDVVFDGNRRAYGVIDARRGCPPRT